MGTLNIRSFGSELFFGNDSSQPRIATTDYKSFYNFADAKELLGTWPREPTNWEDWIWSISSSYTLIMAGVDKKVAFFRKPLGSNITLNDSGDAYEFYVGGLTYLYCWERPYNPTTPTVIIAWCDDLAKVDRLARRYSPPAYGYIEP